MEEGRGKRREEEGRGGNRSNKEKLEREYFKVETKGGGKSEGWKGGEEQNSDFLINFVIFFNFKNIHFGILMYQIFQGVAV
jgi:hypothetical protein